MEGKINEIKNETKQMQIEVRVPTKLIIHNLRKVDLTQITQFAHTPMGLSPLFWCNGYIILLNMLPLDTNSVVDKYLDGEEHFTDVVYCPLENYSESIHVEANQYQDYAIIDVSTSFLHKALVQFISALESQSNK